MAGEKDGLGKLATSERRGFWIRSDETDEDLAHIEIASNCDGRVLELRPAGEGTLYLDSGDARKLAKAIVAAADIMDDLPDYVQEDD